MTVVITAARVDSPAGRVAATIERVGVGGGTQVVTVDGVAEERVHPASTVYHVRFLSPDRMIPDELRAVESFDEACELAEKYAVKLDEHAARVDELAADLKV
jgi:hypothetical protein